ncbi:MAG TPA: hypothetical protein PKA20_14060 [Burkholderiaceae bacterium]|nr:hypothetical protein [Burkholderiaceae bacterium]
MNQPSTSGSRRPVRSSDTVTQMRDALETLQQLYRATRAAMRRQRRLGHLRRAHRLDTHSGFIARMIAALRAELRVTELRVVEALPGAARS